MNTLSSYNQAVSKYYVPSVKSANSVSVYYDRTLSEVPAKSKRCSKNLVILILSLLILVAVLTLIPYLSVSPCNETSLARKSSNRKKEIQLLERQLAEAMKNSNNLRDELARLKRALKGIHNATNWALSNQTQSQ